VHYVFAGRNGTGKSTLLKALAEQRVPGVPANLRVLLLGQTRIAGEKEDDGVGKSVLSYVVTSDEKRERAVRDARCKFSILLLFVS
jgi:ATP-binding cassette, subfamily F, member 3